MIFHVILDKLSSLFGFQVFFLLQNHSWIDSSVQNASKNSFLIHFVCNNGPKGRLHKIYQKQKVLCNEPVVRKILTTLMVFKLSYSSCAISLSLFFFYVCVSYDKKAVPFLSNLMLTNLWTLFHLPRVFFCDR